MDEKEKEKIQNDKYFFRQGLCGILMGLSALSGCLAMGYTSPAFRSMKLDPNFELNDNQESWIASILMGMGALGNALGGTLSNRYGRRLVMISTGVATFISWFCMSFSTNADQIIICRGITGIAMGLQFVTGLVYFNEIVEPELRPVVGICIGLLAAIGFPLVFALGELLAWRALAFFISMVSLPYIIIALYLPETPYYYIKSEDSKQSLNALNWLRKSPEQAKNEFKELQEIQIRKGNVYISFLELKRPPYRWQISLAVGLMIFQQLAGINVVMTYASKIFEDAGSAEHAGLCSIILGVTNFICTILNGKLQMDYKRTVLLKISSIISMISLGTLSIFFYLKNLESTAYIAETFAYIPLLALIGYSFGISIGWGNVPFIFLGEGLTSAVREIGTSLAIISSSATSFYMIKSYIWIVESVGHQGLFAIYVICIAISQMIMNEYLPETKNKTLLQIEEIYQDHAISWYKNRVKKVT